VTDETTPEPRNEPGNVSIIALAGIVLAFVLCVGVARVGAAVVLQSRADTAADAAALAGADALALGGSARAATQAAEAAASDNGARLVECSCAGAVAEVIVEIDREIGRAHGHARADVDLSRGPAPAP
jgi:secretion/DNA translocation related TadE-like protein